MKIVFTGSRHYHCALTVLDALDLINTRYSPYIVIHGDCGGMDKAVAEFYEIAPNVEVIAVPAEWEKYGRAAGPKRNAKMLDMEPDLVVGFLARGSKGTKDCLRQARERKIPTLIIYLD